VRMIMWWYCADTFKFTAAEAHYRRSDLIMKFWITVHLRLVSEDFA